MIELQSINKVYSTPDTNTLALENINMQVSKGEFVAVMGPSGCGKSTLLNLIGLLDTPTSGEYFLMGKEVSGLSEAELSRIRKEHIGFIFQNFNLVDDLTVEENIELALLYRKIPRKEKAERIQHAMEQMQLSHRAKHFPIQLSGGQQQSVAIARAIVGEQSLILADEPTGNLDSENGQNVMKILRKLNERGTSIVMVTHSAQYADFASRKVNLFDGRLVMQSLRAVS